VDGVAVTRRSGLGRGLDALLPAGDEPVADEGFVRAPLASIDPNPRQPRETFDDDRLDELTASVRELGILQPLLVRRMGDRFELVAGERRLRAAKAAGLDEVPALVVETDDRGSLERALVENVQRADLNPIEEAAAYRQLIDEGGLTQEALATRLGKNRVTITNSLRLLDLSTSVQRFLQEGRLTAGHGKALLGLEGSPFQERIARRAADEQISVRETEELVRKFQAMTGSTSRSGGRAPQPAAAAEAQRALSDYLQTRVRVEMGKRKGKIVLDFVSVEELGRLLATITGGTGAQTNAVRLD
jgi:ParB family chromosome partitioning protein